MTILGISAFGQNPAAALLIDGKLIAFAEEERFIRIKSAFGRFPSQSIVYCLQETHIPFAAVDVLAIGWDCRKYRYRMPFFFLNNWLRYGLRNSGGGYQTAIEELIRHRPEVTMRNIRFGLHSVGIHDPLPQIEYIPHHLAHAASTYYASGFPSATIVILDGSGEERVTTIYKGVGKTIDEIHHINLPHSLGWFYAAITAYLGFTPYQDDGFVMGLSSYGHHNGKIREKFNHIVRLSNIHQYSINPRFTMLGKHSFSEHFSDQLVTLFGPQRFPGHPMNQRYKDIAFATQETLEEIVHEIVKNAIETTGERNLCLAGGVALNCKMNGMLTQSGLIDNIFIQPASHDAGAALGAAMAVAMDRGDDPRFRMTHARFGPAYSERAIQNVLNNSGVSYTKPKNLSITIAEAITRGKIVARFEGRMEVGPRALGGRSILANPTFYGMNDSVNRRVKRRESWRPFCPSFLQETAKEYLARPMEDRFMTVVYDVLQKKRSAIPAVVHVDGTTRPQAVSKNSDPNYYDIIKKIGERTGVPAVLNTSLNVKGEPIVCTPADALRCFFSTGIDAMAIGDFWITKRQ